MSIRALSHVKNLPVHKDSRHRDTPSRDGKAFYGTFDGEVLSVALNDSAVAWRYAPTDRRFPFYS